MPAKSGRYVDPVLLLNRLALGAYFALAGWGKVKSGPFSFATSDFFVKARPPWLPPLAHQLYGYGLPYVEIATGVLLILGLYARTAAALQAAILASIMVALGVTGGSGPFDKNVVFFGLALLLAVLGPGRFAVRSA